MCRAVLRAAGEVGARWERMSVDDLVVRVWIASLRPVSWSRFSYCVYGR